MVPYSNRRQSLALIKALGQLRAPGKFLRAEFGRIPLAILAQISEYWRSILDLVPLRADMH
jgi:hypothetical protein